MASLAAEDTSVLSNKLSNTGPRPESAAVAPGILPAHSEEPVDTSATHVNLFSIQEAIPLPSKSLLRLREAACYLAFYLAGYKCGSLIVYGRLFLIV